MWTILGRCYAESTLTMMVHNIQTMTVYLTTMMAIIGPTKAKIIPWSLGNQHLL